MRVKLITFDKYSESTESFEAKVSKLIADIGEITSVSLQSSDERDIIFKFEYTDKPVEQAFYMLPWLQMGNAEEVINNTISHLEEDGKIIKHVTLAVLKTKRAVASLLVQVSVTNACDSTINETKETTIQDQQEDKQDQDANAGTDKGTEPIRKRANRKSPNR